MSILESKIKLNARDYTKLSILELTTHKAGKICKGAAWYVTDGENVFLYKSKSLQCNLNKAVIEHLYPNEQYIYLEIAFINHDYRDYI